MSGADARNEKVWTQHAYEHEQIEAPHVVNKGNPHRSIVTSLEGVNKVMDLGCGSALWRHVFDGYDYYGVDQNEKMIKVAKKRFPKDKFIVCNGMSLDFEDESFDLVFTAVVLQHNKHIDKEIVAREIHRVLRSGGYYFCSENTFREDNYHTTFGRVGWSPDLDDGYSLTSWGWEQFMGKLGLILIKYTEPSEYLYTKR
jgi:ubiquinone/menaquinone biosynthesis C-methylase UbiE